MLATYVTETRQALKVETLKGRRKVPLRYQTDDPDGEIELVADDKLLNLNKLLHSRFIPNILPPGIHIPSWPISL